MAVASHQLQGKGQGPQPGVFDLTFQPSLSTSGMFSCLSAKYIFCQVFGTRCLLSQKTLPSPAATLISVSHPSSYLGEPPPGSL